MITLFHYYIITLLHYYIITLLHYYIITLLRTYLYKMSSLVYKTKCRSKALQKLYEDYRVVNRIKKHDWLKDVLRRRFIEWYKQIVKGECEKKFYKQALYGDTEYDIATSSKQRTDDYDTEKVLMIHMSDLYNEEFDYEITKGSTFVMEHEIIDQALDSERTRIYFKL
jgi:hypothetical protein